MHAVGARALTSATRHLRGEHAVALRVLSQGRSGSPRSFRSSPGLRFPPDDANGSNKDSNISDKSSGSSGAGGWNIGGKDGTATPVAATITKSEVVEKGNDGTRSNHASSGRGRHAANRPSDGLPPAALPQWFIDEEVLVFEPSQAAEQRRLRMELLMAGMDKLRFPVGENQIESTPAGTVAESQDHVAMQTLLGEMFEEVSWDRQNIEEDLQALRDGDLFTPEIRAESVCLLATLCTASLSAQADALAKLQRLVPDEAEEAAAAYLEIQKLLGHEDLLHAFKSVWRSTRTGESLVERPRDEQVPYRELLATIRAELEIKAPSTKVSKDSRRPVTVLSVLNYKGRSIATSVVDDVATDLRADVIHLDAATIGRVIGGYLGQTQYYARGRVSMLGYSAAELNGRLVPRGSSSDAEELQDTQTISITKLYSAFADDRWEELKVNHILEEIIRSADNKRKSQALPLTDERALILHVHDFAEMSTFHEGTAIINKLRSVVDRLWQKGRKVVMVGSTSSDIATTPKWREQLNEVSKDDCYVIPFEASDHAEYSKGRDTLQKDDYIKENTENIRSMLESMLGKSVALSVLNTPDLHPLRTHLSKGIYDVYWVYRLATRILSLRSQSMQDLDTASILHAFQQISQADRLWSKLYADQQDLNSVLPIFPGMHDSAGETDADIVNGRKALSGDFTEHEKKLLSGLVNVDQIKTTFDDVVAPPEIQESLMALTSLSLHRPEAFSYGVLARERIHGCLLYGPPGTGKTLMAKAVAKESGANMLEVSAASINDMWVGNSEKNVRALFSLARKMSPMVIFLDEAESLLGSRSQRTLRGGYIETINQFLREWDGLTNSLNDAKTFVMVATNRPFDLDEAVLRRLPRRILVDLPLRDARLAILQGLLRDEILDPSVSLDQLASSTELYSGSDLKNLCVAAAMEAVKEEIRAEREHKGPEKFEFSPKRTLTSSHFQKARQDISASISEDMDSLKAIRKFDERYGDARRKKRKGLMGFEVVPNLPSSQEARVRQS